MIGDEIKKMVRKRGLKNKAFADLMNMEERNLYHFFKREQMEVDLLLQAGEILDFDFLSLYIRNSKFKNYLENNSKQNSFSDRSSTKNQPQLENQISFSINVKGSIDTASLSMSNFLQSVKLEAEKFGFKLG